jgi:hypothetical protein
VPICCIPGSSLYCFFHKHIYCCHITSYSLLITSKAF